MHIKFDYHPNMTQQEKAHLGIKPKLLNVEGENPKWEKPFCWKCMKHTPFKKGYRTVRSESGSSIREYMKCENCGNKGMHIPAHFDHYYHLGMQPRMYPISIGCFLLLPLFFMCPVIIILLTDDSKAQQEAMFVILISITVFFAGVYGGAILWAEFKYRAWKKWAKLRGWKKPNKSQRIKIGGKKR